MKFIGVEPKYLFLAAGFCISASMGLSYPEPTDTALTLFAFGTLFLLPVTYIAYKQRRDLAKNTKGKKKSGRAPIQNKKLGKKGSIEGVLWLAGGLLVFALSFLFKANIPVFQFLVCFGLFTMAPLGVVLCAGQFMNKMERVADGIEEMPDWKRRR